MVEIKCQSDLNWSEQNLCRANGYRFIDRLVEMYHLNLNKQEDIAKLNAFCNYFIAFHYLSDIQLVLLKKYLESKEEVIIKKKTHKKVTCLFSDDDVYKKVKLGIKTFFWNRFSSLSFKKLTPLDRERISFNFDVLTDLLNYGVFNNLSNYDFLKETILNRNLINLSNKKDAIDAVQLKYMYANMGSQEFLKKVIPFIFSEHLDGNQYFDNYVLPRITKKKIK